MKTINYKGPGYYDKYEGELIELAELYREVKKGEVYEGSKADWDETFNPDY